MKRCKRGTTWSLVLGLLATLLLAGGSPAHARHCRKPGDTTPMTYVCRWPARIGLVYSSAPAEHVTPGGNISYGIVAWNRGARRMPTNLYVATHLPGASVLVECDPACTRRTDPYYHRSDGYSWAGDNTDHAPYVWWLGRLKPGQGQRIAFTIRTLTRDEWASRLSCRVNYVPTPCPYPDSFATHAHAQAMRVPPHVEFIEVWAA